MKKKSLLVSAIVIGTLSIAPVSFANQPTVAVNSQPSVILLGAKIENALAELEVDKTKQDIQNTTNLVLSEEDIQEAIQLAALDMVIHNAKAAGDNAVVAALTEFKWEVSVAEEVVDAVQERSIAKPAFPPPPDVAKAGRSDY